MAIISGLSLGANHNELAVDLLFDTLMGNIPSLEGNFHYQDICCVVFVGNSLSLTRRSDDSGKVHLDEKSDLII